VRVSRRQESKKQDVEETETTDSPIYEIGDYGVLIQLHPVRQQFVKECREGRMVRKSACGNVPFKRDASGNYFYLVTGEKVPIDDMIPSRWDDLKKETT